MKRNTPAVELKNVWKIYKLDEVDVVALRGLDLKVRRGEFIAVMGSSGSGKSTAMNMIGALDIPSKGKVLIDGKDITKFTESDLSQIRGKTVGFVFQQFNLLHNLSALENVTIPMTFQGLSRHKRIERGKDLLKKVGLENRIEHQPAQLSGGERQRIAIARALANDPEIILADEPTGNLDSTTGKKIMEMFIDLHKKEKKTLIMITHDPLIANYADKIYLLKDGKIMKDGKNRRKYMWGKAR